MRVTVRVIDLRPSVLFLGFKTSTSKYRSVILTNFVKCPRLMFSNECMSCLLIVFNSTASTSLPNEWIKLPTRTFTCLVLSLHTVKKKTN